MYTVWCDYGMEGWSPKDFDTFPEAVEFLLNGGYCCSAYRITKEVHIEAVETDCGPAEDGESKGDSDE